MSILLKYIIVGGINRDIVLAISKRNPKVWSWVPKKSRAVTYWVTDEDAQAVLDMVNATPSAEPVLARVERIEVPAPKLVLYPGEHALATRMKSLKIKPLVKKEISGNHTYVFSGSDLLKLIASVQRRHLVWG